MAKMTPPPPPPNEAPLDLSALATPKMTVVDPSGKTREYDLFETAEKMGDLAARPAESAQDFDAIRVAFGFPTAAQAAAANEKPLHPLHCIRLALALSERINGVEEVKKISALSPK